AAPPPVARAPIQGAAPAPRPAPKPTTPPPVTAPVAQAEPTRRRTGTPQLGVPVVEPPPVEAPVEAPRPKTPTPQPVVTKETVREYVQPPVAGTIDAPTGRAKRASSSGGQPDAPGISQVWYEDGDRASQDDEPDRPRKTISPSSTDMSLYDE